MGTRGSCTHTHVQSISLLYSFTQIVIHPQLVGSGGGGGGVRSYLYAEGNEVRDRHLVELGPTTPPRGDRPGTALGLADHEHVVVLPLHLRLPHLLAHGVARHVHVHEELEPAQLVVHLRRKKKKRKKKKRKKKKKKKRENVGKVRRGSVCSVCAGILWQRPFAFFTDPHTHTTDYWDLM